MAGRRLTLSAHSLLLLIHLRVMQLGPLGVLLGEGAMLGRLLTMRISRSPHLLSLGRVSVRFLTVACRFGGKALS
jgi:hypothetical protein